MKSIRVNQFGEPPVLEYSDMPTPTPGAGQVLVKVGGAGVNPVDTYIRAGTYPVLPELPYTPGLDIAGTVISTGEGVGVFETGDRVYSSRTVTGGYSEYVLCTSEQLFPLPEKISFIQGAAVGAPAATAWRALFIRGKAEPGQRVLIHGGSGSVGSAAIQLAKAAGLEVYGTASTEDGLNKMQQDGAAMVFNHSDSSYTEQIKNTCDGGFELILEMLANVNLCNDFEFAAPKGRIVIIGSRGMLEIDPRATMGKELEVCGLALLSSSEIETRKTHAALVAAMETGAYTPRISKTLPLEEAAKAHDLVMRPGNCGKIVLVP